MEDLRLCGSAGSKKSDTSTPIIPSEAITEGESTAETEDNDAAGLILPPEVVIEILSWLPLRSIAKLQVVCREWRGFIRGHYFMERNMDRSKVICHWQNCVKPDDAAKADPNGEVFVLVAGCDGMLLLMSARTRKLTIWNPTTHGVLRLPDAHKGAFGVSFNYVRSTGNYVVVSVYKDDSGGESCEVLTPGKSESWRPLAFPDVAEAEGHREKQLVRVVSAGEVVHTVLTLEVGSTVTKKVVSLDLETERFTVTCFDETKFDKLESFWAMDWDGKLALTTFVGTNLHVMVLEDYKKQRWCQQNKVVSLPFLREGDDLSILMPLFAKDGDIWFRLGESFILTHTIETGRSTSMHSRGLSPGGKLYPYKPTLAGVQGMHQDPEFGKRWSSQLNP